MKTWFKIVFKLNQKWCYSCFPYSTEEEKAEHLKRWKAEHNTPYNKLEIIWYGDVEEYDFDTYA